MSESGVLYSDVKFTKKSGKTPETDSLPTETTYSEVNILNPEPSTEPTGSKQQEMSSRPRSKVTSARVALVVLLVLLVAAGIALVLISCKNAQNAKLVQKLTQKLDVMEKNITVENCPGPVIITNYTCPKCENDWEHEDWEQHGEKFYYFSNETSTWEQSRRKCIYRGGDLVTIYNQTEQDFLSRKLNGLMRDNLEKFWIGLTDSKNESTWLWVDNSPLNYSFWRFHEPDNWFGNNGEFPDGEDCARMGEGSGDARWFDKACNTPQRYICDKSA